GELVDGRPARVWDIRYKGVESHWGSTGLSAYATDRWTLAPNATLNLGARFDFDSGSAEGAANGITSATLLRRATLRWPPRADSPLAGTAGYSWYRNRLPLEYLAVGDPQG